MRRLAVLLSVAFLLAATGAQARPQRDALVRTPHHAAARSAGPGWTPAILGGVAVMVVFGAAGVAAGRASVRPQARLARHA